MKVGHSRVVALARFLGVEGRKPFTNATPPTAYFRVTRAIRGCEVGERLSVSNWGRRPERRSSPLLQTAEERRAKHDEWARTTIELPATGSEALLLLGGDDGVGGTLRGFDARFPDCLMTADARQVELAVGFATFQVEVSAPEEIKLERGDELVLPVMLANASQTSARFDVSSLRLTTGTPSGESQTNIRPTQEKLPVIVLAPGQRQELSWNLSKLFPGVFVAPGDYWLQLEMPAQGGDRIQRHVEIVESSLAYVCGRAGAILRTRVAPLAGDPSKLRLDDPIYVRLRGERLPDTIAWPANRSRPAGRGRRRERVILCGTGSAIVWIEPDTPESRQRIRDLIANDSDAEWPRDEDRDPRFIPDPGPEQPAVEQRHLSLDRRLQVE
jgi:hypothetical protein